MLLDVVVVLVVLMLPLNKCCLVVVMLIVLVFLSGFVRSTRIVSVSALVGLVSPRQSSNSSDLSRVASPTAQLY